MIEKFEEIKKEVQKNPDRYPALYSIHERKKEIRTLLNRAERELKMMVKENPKKFPHAQTFFAHVDEWKKHHMK
jgi:hypothetical protein